MRNHPIWKRNYIRHIMFQIWPLRLLVFSTWRIFFNDNFKNERTMWSFKGTSKTCSVNQWSWSACKKHIGWFNHFNDSQSHSILCYTKRQTYEILNVTAVFTKMTFLGNRRWNRKLVTWWRFTRFFICRKLMEDFVLKFGIRWNN